MSDLFRREAVEHHRQRLFGEVVLTLPVTHWAVTMLIALAILLLLSVLIFGTYARKESIGGWVRPDRGMIRVQAQDDGLVETVWQTEGQHVEAGAPLVSLRLDPDVAGGRSFAKQLSGDLEGERRTLSAQLEAAKAQFAVREAKLRSEIFGLEREIAQSRLRLDVLDKRVALAQRQLDDRATLVRQGFVAKLDAEKFEDAVLAAKQLREEQGQDSVLKENKLNSARYELISLPHDRTAALATIGERVALLEQRLTEAGRRSHVVLTAPVAGRIADIRVEPGETAKAKTVLVEILPEGGGLQVELFAPSRATGFLAIGSEVQLRYDAFPYQKFGVSTGRILRISRSTMDARDLPRTMVADEPVYRVIVSIDHDHVVLDGKKRQLQAGMTLKADLILERRRVAEFLFAPLLGALRRG